MTAQTRTINGKKRRLIGVELTAERWAIFEAYCYRKNLDPLETINNMVDNMIEGCCIDDITR